ncbi:MAG: class II glutamine amidotransferase [bacterium]
MCRLFGFRSVILSQVHKSLVHAENALMTQSESHPDGWGIGYYVAGAPHIVKSVLTAVDDHLFKRISGIVSSQTVLAHIRKATCGELSIVNTHPFQYGRWVFAHNGTLKGFSEAQAALKHKIAPTLSRFILGETDSEVLFYLILTHLSRRVELHQAHCDLEVLEEAVREALHDLKSVIGDFSEADNGKTDETYLTFILTNGETMLAHQGGKGLYYSTYKTKCGDREKCVNYAPECESPTQTGSVNHLIFSSEPLQGENIWLPMKPGQKIGVDHRMKLRIYS